MSLVTEARRRYQPDEITPITHDAETAAVELKQLTGMYASLELEGQRREAALAKLAEGSRGGGFFYVPYTSSSKDTDFYRQANYKWLKEHYPWLHEKENLLGIDVESAEEARGSLELYLASLPHEDWSSFVELLDSMVNGDVLDLDTDAAYELEMVEWDRWIKEDGGPDLIKSMIRSVNDAYEGYLLSKVTPDLVWDWMSSTEHYPESQGDGSVWLDMDELGEEIKTHAWFLERLDDDAPGWEATKRAFYERKSVADRFEQLLKKLAGVDERIAYVVSQLDGEQLWSLFKQAFPDERRESEDPYWYLWSPYWSEPPASETERKFWCAGYENDTTLNPDAWQAGYSAALSDLERTDWFLALLRRWTGRPEPTSHSELRFEAQELPKEADDPEIYLRYNGGMRETKLYEDDRLIVMVPRDMQSLNFRLGTLGLSPIAGTQWHELFKYADVFVLLGKEADLVSGHQERMLGVIRVYDYKVHVFNNTAPQALGDLLNHPEYGRHIRRALCLYFRKALAKNPLFINVLLTLGGVSELRRARQRGDVGEAEYTFLRGMAFAQASQFRRAASMLGRDASTVDAGGVWLFFKDVSELSEVFENSKAAEEVFANEIYDWFDFYYDKHNLPSAEDVLPYTPEKAKKHIYDIVANREVWFPDGGPEGEGEYVLMTPKNLQRFDVDTVVGWVATAAADEDVNFSVFEDIIDVLRQIGADMLSGLSQDKLLMAYIKEAVEAVRGTSHKWGTFPKSGKEAFTVYVPWANLLKAAETYQENHDELFSGSLEDLVTSTVESKASVDADHHQADWSDVKKMNPEHRNDFFYRLYELEAPDLPAAKTEKSQPDLFSEAQEAVDNPQSNAHLFSGVPLALEKALYRIATAQQEMGGPTISNFRVIRETPSEDELQITVRFKTQLGMYGEPAPYLATVHYWSQQFGISSAYLAIMHAYPGYAGKTVQLRADVPASEIEYTVMLEREQEQEEIPFPF